MSRILITRHGQTKENVNDILQGYEGELTQEGLEQVRRLAERLKDENIDKIASSNVTRCRVTTEEIVKRIPVPVEYTPLIREKEYGDWAGKNRKEVNWKALNGDFETIKPPNGENLIEVRERGRRFFNTLVERYGNCDKTILVVSHGVFLKTFVGNMLGMSLYDSMFKLNLDNCSLTELELNKGYKTGYRFNFINQNEYLRSSDRRYNISKK